MTYQEIYEKVRDALKNADANTVSGKLAIEFFITGEGEGKFYVLVDGGKVYVEPYDYVDNDARLIADADSIIKIANGKLKPEAAYVSGVLKVEGNVGRALDLKPLIESAMPPKRKRKSKEEVEAEKAAKEAEKAAKEAEKAAKEAEKAAKASEKEAAAKAPAKSEEKAPAKAVKKAPAKKAPAKKTTK